MFCCCFYFGLLTHRDRTTTVGTDQITATSSYHRIIWHTSNEKTALNFCLAIQGHGTGWMTRSWTTLIGLQMSLILTMERSEPQMGYGGQVVDGTTEHTSVKHPKVIPS